VGIASILAAISVPDALVLGSAGLAVAIMEAWLLALAELDLAPILRALRLVEDVAPWLRPLAKLLARPVRLERVSPGVVAYDVVILVHPLLAGLSAHRPFFVALIALEAVVTAVEAAVGSEATVAVPHAGLLGPRLAAALVPDAWPAVIGATVLVLVHPAARNALSVLPHAELGVLLRRACRVLLEGPAGILAAI